MILNQQLEKKNNEQGKYKCMPFFSELENWPMPLSWRGRIELELIDKSIRVF